MVRKIISFAVTEDYKNVFDALKLLCDKKYFNKSKVMKEAIRKEVQDLLKQYPDVKELIKRTALLYSQYLGVNT